MEFVGIIQQVVMSTLFDERDLRVSKMFLQYSMCYHRIFHLSLSVRPGANYGPELLGNKCYFEIPEVLKLGQLGSSTAITWPDIDNALSSLFLIGSSNPV
jgi:hypothetical protein